VHPDAGKKPYSRASQQPIRIGVGTLKEPNVKRQPSMARLAIFAALAMPVVLSAYRRGRSRDYTRSPEFRSIVGDFLI
jgi:hypothetical protein